MAYEMSKLEVLAQKKLKRQMKAALKMIRVFTDLSEGKHNLEHDNWIDLYTYEPLKYGQAQLLGVINALLCLADRSELDWEFRLFATDGMITTRADGSKPEDDESGVELILWPGE